MSVLYIPFAPIGTSADLILSRQLQIGLIFSPQIISQRKLTMGDSLPKSLMNQRLISISLRIPELVDSINLQGMTG